MCTNVFFKRDVKYVVESRSLTRGRDSKKTRCRESLSGCESESKIKAVTPSPKYPLNPGETVRTADIDPLVASITNLIS